MFIFNFISKVICKVIVLFSLVALTLFNSVLKVAFFIFGLLSVPVSTIVLIAGIVLSFKEGFSKDIFTLFSVSVILVSLKYLLPLLPKSLDMVKFNMKEYLYEPIIVRSPVKYTI